MRILLLSFLLLSISFMAFGAIDTIKFSGQKIGVSEVKLYEKFELATGDTIITYNDKPLTNPNDAMELYSMLKKNRISKLLIERKGSYLMLKAK